MKGLHFKGPQDYLALLVRRRWWIIFPFLALSTGALLVTYILPKMYVSETLILIRPRDVPDIYVPDANKTSTEERLSAIQQTVLSRTNLIKILQEFEDKLPEYKSLNMDERVLKLNSQIDVRFEAERRGGVQLPVTYFRVSYRSRSPELAQKVAAKLTSLFIEQDNRARETQVFGTTEFLSGELEKVAEELKQSETKLKEIRGRRRYELPDQVETNLRTLDRLNLQKQANAEAVDRSATMRLNLERLMSETPAVIARQVPAGIIPKVSVKNTLVEEYNKKHLELIQLIAKYTPKHPEVQAAALELQRLKEQIPPKELEAAEQADDKAPPAPALTATTMPNPAYQNLVSQLQEVKTESEIRERERKFIDADIEKYSGHIQNGPQSQQEIAEVLRQNSELTKQYEGLKSSLAQAKLSESLESRQKSSQFVIVDPANYPLQPTKPAKLPIALGAVITSLVAGIAIAVGADVANQKIWTQSEIEGLLGAAVLVEIPEIVTKTDIARTTRWKLTFAASSVAAFAVYGLCLYLIYAHQASVLRHLDPFLQKLY